MYSYLVDSKFKSKGPLCILNKNTFLIHFVVLQKKYIILNLLYVALYIDIKETR